MEKWVKVKLLSRVRLSATPRTAAPQAPVSMGFSRQEYWSGVPLPSPLQTPSILLFHPPNYFKAGVLNALILQMQLRHRKVKQLDQGNTVKKL